MYRLYHMTPYWDPESENSAQPTLLPYLKEVTEAMCFGSTSSHRPSNPPARRPQHNYYDNRLNPYTYHGMPTTIGSGRLYTDALNWQRHDTLLVKHPLQGVDCHRFRVDELREMLAQLYEIRARREINDEASVREDEARSASIEVVERYLEREGWRRGNDPSANGLY